MLAFLLFTSIGCDRTEHKGGSQSRKRVPQASSPDKIYNENVAFRYETRMLYNSRKFDELEKRANELRISKARFGNGAWKLREFYDALGLRPDEPESLWRLHEQIHQDWEKAMPNSVTARSHMRIFFAITLSMPAAPVLRRLLLAKAGSCLRSD